MVPHPLACLVHCPNSMPQDRSPQAFKTDACSPTGAHGTLQPASLHARQLCYLLLAGSCQGHHPGPSTGSGRLLAARACQRGLLIPRTSVPEIVLRHIALPLQMMHPGELSLCDNICQSVYLLCGNIYTFWHVVIHKGLSSGDHKATK